MGFAALVFLGVIGVLTGLSIKAEQPRVRRLCRTILLSLAIGSTVLLAASVASFVVLARDHADSPAGAIPMALAFLCAAAAVPTWIGVAIQSRLRRR